MSLFSYSNWGYEGALVTVETDLRRGIPMIDIVGLADGAVKESRERVKAAIKNSGFEFPSERVLISLSPADLKKEGAGFDLPMALAVLSEKDDYPRSQDARVMVMGELELSGNLRRRIKLAWERQYKRQGKLNQDLNPQEVADYIKTTGGVKNELERLNLNARTILNILKLARTLADMNDIEEAEVITERHLDIALKIRGHLPGIVEDMGF